MVNVPALAIVLQPAFSAVIDVDPLPRFPGKERAHRLTRASLHTFERFPTLSVARLMGANINAWIIFSNVSRLTSFGTGVAMWN